MTTSDFVHEGDSSSMPSVSCLHGLMYVLLGQSIVPDNNCIVPDTCFGILLQKDTQPE